MFVRAVNGGGKTLDSAGSLGYAFFELGEWIWKSATLTIMKRFRCVTGMVLGSFSAPEVSGSVTPAGRVAVDGHGAVFESSPDRVLPDQWRLPVLRKMLRKTASWACLEHRCRPCGDNDEAQFRMIHPIP
jgi:hypothetical protein